MRGLSECWSTHCLYWFVLKMKYKLTLAFLLMMMGWMGL